MSGKHKNECACKDPTHDYEKMIEGVAKAMLARPKQLRAVWRNWSDKSHRNYKSPEFMERVKDAINRINGVKNEF